MKDIFTFLLQHGNHGAEEAAEFLVNYPDRIPLLMEAVGENENKRLKNAALKALWLVSEQQASLLMDHFPIFYQWVEKEDSIVQWNAIRILGNLAEADHHNLINEEVVGELCYLVKYSPLITANHAVVALGKIALGKPAYRDGILAFLAHSDQYKKDTEECNNIMAGKVLLVFQQLTDYLEEHGDVKAYAERQLNCERASTVQKAQRLLKMIEQVDDTTEVA
jgi:hypothetical protein